MKLISLAALSFLAITVSAYPGLGTPHQGAGAPSAEQSQNTGTPSAEQCQNAAERNAVQYQFCLIQRARQRYEQELQAESQMLAKLYKEEQGLAHDMGALLIEMEREQLQLREVISGLEGNIPEQDKVIAMLIAQDLTMEEVRASLKATLQDMDGIMKHRNIAEEKLKLLS